MQGNPELKNLEGAIEAILFTMGEAVASERLAEALSQDVDTIRRVVRNMMDYYDDDSRGIKIIEVNDSFQMCTKASQYDAIIKVAHVPKKYVLTEVLLETLSIIAYKQPITRMGVETIRGVNCEHAMSKLMEYELIQEVGRLDAPGRPILFATTDEFLRHFGLTTLDDLPEIKQEMIDDFKEEVEKEVQLSLNL